MDALLQHAETGLEKRDYSQAEMDLNRVLALKPDPEVYFLLARLNQARGDVLLYRQNLAEALRLNPRLLAVRVELVQSLVANAAGAQAALDYLNQAPADQQATLPVIVARNWAYWTLGDLAQMRKGIDLGLSRERSAELLMQDGLWKLRSGNPQAARASLEEALKINPGDLRALEALQQTYIADKNNATALQKVKEYANESKSVPAQDFLAMLLMAKGDKVQARSVLVAAKAADPQFIQADLELVQLDYAEHKLPDARKRLEELVARDNGNAVAHLWLSVIDEHMGDYNNAIAHLQQVVTLAPNDAHASNNLAYLLAESRNEPDSALKYAQRAVELQPSDPAYRDTLGWVLYRKGQYSQAVQNLEIAGSRQGNPVWKYHLAMAYAKNGDIPRGRTILDAALKLNPNLPEAQTARQLIEAAR
ncbi:MAG TPA: tetratricopeptide repeat protein [Blastocatellia bacterium]|nr:tetratricopeptide repeat protein [Blastocatellia bacterium]